MHAFSAVAVPIHYARLRTVTVRSLPLSRAAAILSLYAPLGVDVEGAALLASGVVTVAILPAAVAATAHCMPQCAMAGSDAQPIDPR